ncbi:MAG: recombinase RecT, partial [Ruminococcaceae bacterium]|nr:recombinase RecT [Oscillospiraceae bacterium]
MARDIIQKSTENKPSVNGKPKTMQDYIKIMESEIKKALPSVITPERFTRITLSALSTNPKLADTTPMSFLGAMMTAAQLGLEVNTPLGQAYLIPFKNKGVLECQFQLGYKGLIDLAYRSGEVSIIQAHTVYENDDFVYELGLNPKLEHVPATENRGDPIFFYAVFKTKSEGYGFEVMSVDDVKRHAKKYSQSYGSTFSPWTNNFEEMAKKTV